MQSAAGRRRPARFLAAPILVATGLSVAAASGAMSRAPQARGAARSPAAPQAPVTPEAPAAPQPPPRPPSEAIEALAAGDEAARFDAIEDLVGSDHAATARLLQEAAGTARFTRPGPARQAMEFVRAKRAGKTIGRAGAALRGGKHVLLVSIDTLRADTLGCYGYRRNTSPAIDALAARGARFDRALSPSSWTLPVHMSIFTSRYPSFHGVERSGERWNVRLPDSETPMAVHLKEAGYVTAAFVANPFLDARWGFDRGFDLYRRRDADAREQSDRAVLWLEWQVHRRRTDTGAARLFLFLHYNDPHLPYAAPQEYRDRFPATAGAAAAPPPTGAGTASPPAGRPCVSPRPYRVSPHHVASRALYDAEVSYLDTHFGRFLDRLEALGLRDASLLIVTSDHGEEFGEHGGATHKLTLYDEVLRVPLILSDPRLLAPRQGVADPVSLLDLLPTVIEAIGRPAPAGLQGVSLIPHLRRAGAASPIAPVPYRPLFADLGPVGQPWDMPFHRKAVLTRAHKLIENHGRDGRITRELYDLVDDPGERCNVYDEQRGTRAIQDLEAHLERFVREGLAYRQAAGEGTDFELTDELRERLRSLGYID
jgi:arylsulfatase A-like enzyme